MIRTWLGLTAMALLLTVSPDPAGLQSGPSSAKFRPHPGGLSSYLVVLNNAAAGPRGSSHASSIAQDLQSRNGIESVLVSEWAWDMFSIRASEAIARRVSDDPRVKYVEQDTPAHLTNVQSSAPWDLDRIDQRTGLDGAYTYNTDGTGVSAYIIDTGIRTTHVEFGGRAVFGADFGGDVCQPPQGGSPDPIPTTVTGDPIGHGTEVASLVGGATYGSAKGVRLVSIRVFDPCGVTSNDTIISGIDWMIADHANRGGSAVANISIGWDAAWGRISAVEDKVQEAINAGITIVASAGNKNQDAGCCTLSDMTSVIVVGASDINDARAVFDSQQSSNYGSTVNVFAPGLNVTVASNGSDTDAILDSGTSMSAPIIAGLVARYLQATPGASPAAAQSAIASNATYTPSIGATPNLLAFSGWLDTGGGGPGRWKLDGNGGCYWDPNDSGPDQCSPTPGRWKLDANGNCYWDPNDSGPNQCNGTTTPSADRVRETFAHIFGLRPKISRIRSAPLDASHQ